MADNTQNESGNRSSGISSGIIEKGVAIPGPDLPLMVRSGDSAANRRKARKAKKEEDMEIDMDIEGESEEDFESNIRSSGMSSGIVEEGVAILGPDIQLMVRSGDSAANRRKARKAKKGEDMEMDLDIEGGCEGDFESNIRSSGMSSGIVEKAVAVPGSDLPLMVQSGDVAANRRKARNAKGENQDSTDKEQ